MSNNYIDHNSGCSLQDLSNRNIQNETAYIDYSIDQPPQFIKELQSVPRMQKPMKKSIAPLNSAL